MAMLEMRKMKQNQFSEQLHKALKNLLKFRAFNIIFRLDSRLNYMGSKFFKANSGKWILLIKLLFIQNLNGVYLFRFWCPTRRLFFQLVKIGTSLKWMPNTEWTVFLKYGLWVSTNIIRDNNFQADLTDMFDFSSLEATAQLKMFSLWGVGPFG